MQKRLLCISKYNHKTKQYELIKTRDWKLNTSLPIIDSARNDLWNAMPTAWKIKEMQKEGLI